MDKWDSRFMELAELVSTWSKDPGTQVGSVIVDDRHRVKGLGFNGFPRGIADAKNLLSDRNSKLAITLHAEDNAILNANADVYGDTLYVYPMMPCSVCASRIIQVGITRVVAPTRVWRGTDPYLVRRLFEEASVEVFEFV